MLDLRSLEYFVAIIDHRSVSAAADHCYVSQPAVSRQLKRFEALVGSPLFHRLGTGMVLTGMGRRLEPIARDLIRRHAIADEVVRALHDGAPRFVVACPASTANFFIDPFVARGGEIRDVIPLPPAEVYSALGTRADIAVTTSIAPPRFVSIVTASLPITVQVRRSECRVPHSGVELAELARSPFFIPAHGSAVDKMVRDAAAEIDVNLAWAIPVSSGTLAQARSASGAGSAVCVEPERFGLVSRPLLAEGVPLVIPLHVAWDPDHYAEREIRVLAHALSDWIGASDLTVAS